MALLFKVQVVLFMYRVRLRILHSEPSFWSHRLSRSCMRRAYNVASRWPRLWISGFGNTPISRVLDAVTLKPGCLL